MRNDTQLFLEVNSLPNKHPYNLYKSSVGSESFRRLTGLIQQGLKIPYHHRPTCGICGHHYLPNHYKDFKCGNCRNNKKDKQLDSYSPTDLKELKIPAEEALLELALPITLVTIEWYNSLIWEEEEIALREIKQLLG